MTSIVWFRQDLRLSDNPALTEAARLGKIIPLFILDDEAAGKWKKGAASRVWLHHALENLNNSLDGHLILKKGNAEGVLKDLIKETNATTIHWNRCYEPWRIKRDKTIKENMDIECHSYNGSLLWEPWTIKNQKGDWYKVFSPFYRKGCLNAAKPRTPLDRPNLEYTDYKSDLSCHDLNLLPSSKEGNWQDKMMEHWTASEEGAYGMLSAFLQNGLHNYKEGRNIPSENFVSRLSPYLHWGHISPNQVWYASENYANDNKISQKDIEHFHSELGWREFSYNLLYNYPDLPEKPLQEKFKDFPWTNDDEKLEKWKHGQTGYPIVDAAMRELWETGYMHNRTRMIVGSFLVKNMLLNWQEGENWFWDTLVDADLANNSASWQWIAGCGADAAPYFRIFNPWLQSERFDKEGEYIKKWIPELKDVPAKKFHDPEEMATADIDGYPKPMLNHSETRDRALRAYDEIKG